MVHGELVRKATSMYGAELVEEVFTTLEVFNGDVEKVRMAYKVVNNHDAVDCLNILHPEEISPTFLFSRKKIA